MALLSLIPHSTPSWHVPFSRVVFRHRLRQVGTLEEFGVCYSDRGMMAGHMAIPISSAEGILTLPLGVQDILHRLGPVFDAKLAVDAAQMELHRDLADVEGPADLRVGQAIQKLLQDVGLA